MRILPRSVYILVLNYANMVQENFSEIEIYVNEIDTSNESFEELIRFRSQEIFNCLFG